MVLIRTDVVWMRILPPSGSERYRDIDCMFRDCKSGILSKYFPFFFPLHEILIQLQFVTNNFPLKTSISSKKTNISIFHELLALQEALLQLLALPRGKLLEQRKGSHQLPSSGIRFLGRLVSGPLLPGKSPGIVE